MSKLANYAHEFLEDVGYNLGYDENSLPKLRDIGMIWNNRVPIWEYKGMT